MRITALALILSQLSSPIIASPESTYRDSTLHFSFNYPSDMKNVAVQGAIDDLASGQSDPEKKKAYSCVTAPLAAMRRVDALFDEVLLLRLDLDCLRQTVSAKDLSDFTHGVIKTSLVKHGTPVLESESVRTLADHPAYLIRVHVDESEKVPGQILYVTSLCTLVEHSAVCWQVLSYSAFTRQQLSSSTVTFDGQAPVPLVVPDKLSN